ncbi:MAG: LOG family protein [Chloroflexi bacterium]|nr:LOG family protein [Chloroflexota bacterium]
MTVGVMGSSGGKIRRELRHRMRVLGALVARHGHVLVTGACPGLPHEAVKGASKEKGFVVGISPALNLEEHVMKYHSPTQGYDVIVYTGSGLMGREIENIRSCDVVVFAGGRSGTLGEFAIAYDEGKVIGVLEGSGGVTDHLAEIMDMVKKDTGALICTDPDPECLLEKMEGVYKELILPQHIQLLESHDPNGVENST